MGKSSKAPSQPTTSVNLGQFGSATTGKKGSNWTGSDFQNQFASNAANQALTFQNLIGNPELSEQRINDLNRTTNLNFQNQMLNPALSKGLLRGSTAQDIYSVGQQNYANAYQQALDDEEQRNLQRLATAFGNYNDIYNMALGTLGASQKDNQAAANYALSKAELDNKYGTANQLYGLISQGIGQSGNIAKAVAMSDKRLKENIKKLDEIDGYNIYEFNYIGKPERQVGVIAQEVIDKCSDCVLLGADGYYMVDYSKLPQEVQKRIEELK